MAGLVLENLSWKKLVGCVIVLLLFQIAFFLIGGLISPNPSYVHQLLSVTCLDEGTHLHKSRWFIPRGEHQCKETGDLKAVSDPNRVVFAMQFPLPKDKMDLTMHALFQNLIATLQLEIPWHKDHHITAENPTLKLDARLGYRNKDEAEDAWHELARSEEIRPLDCHIEPDQMEEGTQYNCSMLPLFVLGSVSYDYYLLNIRLPVSHHAFKPGEPNIGIGAVEKMWAFVIHQNGGFTQVWFSLKTFLFPIILVAVIWFWRRVTRQDRPSNLLERMVFSLGMAMAFLDLPVDWLSLAADMPFMLFFSDLRQGLFYSVLMCFWIIFLGEHMMDQQERNRFSLYWKHLSAVAFGCICLFVFEICERGVQLNNPFYSIWATDSSSKVGLAFIILAGIAAGIYFLFLCYMLIRVLWNIRAKRAAISHMSSVRRKFYKGVILRFRFMLLSTLVCAALTLCFFIVGQISEGYWKWGDEELNIEYTSAFLTGVYGMWNIYVFALVILYAPSTKASFPESDAMVDNSDETVHFNQSESQTTSETVALADFARKANVD